MKKILAAILFCISLFILTQTSVVAQQRGVGLGAIINGPTGISYKAWIDQRVAIAGAIDFSIGDGPDFFYTHADVIVQGKNLMEGESANEGSLSFYYGGGVALTFFNNPDNEHVDLRIPLGMVYGLEDAPVDAFVELVPTLQVIENTRFSLNGAFGVRFYLN